MEKTKFIDICKYFAGKENNIPCWVSEKKLFALDVIEQHNCDRSIVRIIMGACNYELQDTPETWEFLNQYCDFVKEAS